MSDKENLYKAHDALRKCCNELENIEKFKSYINETEITHIYNEIDDLANYVTKLIEEEIGL